MRASRMSLPVATVAILVCASAALAQVPQPHHRHFVIDSDMSLASVSMFAGGGSSKLAGHLTLYMPDPSVYVIAIAGMNGISVDRADLYAPDLPVLPGLPNPPRIMVNDPLYRSIGSWYTPDASIILELYLTTPQGPMPLPQPVYLNGTYKEGVLELMGDNHVMDATLSLEILAHEVNAPPGAMDLLFSTEVDFVSAPVGYGPSRLISDGDLLSRRGFVYRTNHQLTGKLGIMPIVPDLGLDAAMIGPKREVWFSFEEANLNQWSESLRCVLKHGDLLSEAGRVVYTNEALLKAFVRMPVATDAGLDAVTRAPNRDLLFSTETGFFSEALGRSVGHGDLLSMRGKIVRTNAQLLERFHIFDPTMGPAVRDYGLDAVLLRPLGEVWFSTEVGFQDEFLGWVGSGDLLSSRGNIVAREHELLAAFRPEPSPISIGIGLDCATLVTRCMIGDFNFDGAVDQTDLGDLQNALSGPSLTTTEPDVGDLDGDGDSDQVDFGIFQRCLGSEWPATEIECE